MKKLIIYLGGLCYLLNFSACSHHYYAPNEAMMLQLDKKNDLKVAASVGNAENDYYNLQAGYSPFKHVAVAGNFFKVQAGENMNFPQKTHGFAAEGAIGTYYLFELNPTKERQFLGSTIRSKKRTILFDLYTGYSTGKVNTYYEKGGQARLYFQKNYIQAGIHFKAKIISFSYAFKREKLRYSQIDALLPISDRDILIMEGLVRNRFNVHTHNWRLTGNINYAQLYFGFSSIVSPPYVKIDLDNGFGESYSEPFMHNGNIHVGVLLDINLIYKNFKKNN